MEDTSPKYVGKVVYAERIEPTPKHTDYNDGEYIIIRESANEIHGVTTAGGVKSHELVALPLLGRRRYGLLSVMEDDELIEMVATEIEKFVSSGGGYGYSERVYEGAAENASQLRKILAIHAEKKIGLLRLNVPCTKAQAKMIADAVEEILGVPTDLEINGCCESERSDGPIFPFVAGPSMTFPTMREVLGDSVFPFPRFPRY